MNAQKADSPIMTPLAGRRIVVTRSSSQAADFAARLRALGAEAIQFPTIEIVPPDSYDMLDSAIARLNTFDWVIFTSATGVEHFVQRLESLGRKTAELSEHLIGAIGPATAARLERCGLRAAAVPVEYRAEAIIDAIGEARIAGRSFLIPRAQVARQVLPELLHAKGARDVVVAPAYRTVSPHAPEVARIRELLATGSIDLVTFTSSSTASNFAAMVEPMTGTVRAAVIGPITAATARELGFSVVVAPAEYTVEALTHAIIQYFDARP